MEFRLLVGDGRVWRVDGGGLVGKVVVVGKVGMCIILCGGERWD